MLISWSILKHQEYKNTNSKGKHLSCIFLVPHMHNFPTTSSAIIVSVSRLVANQIVTGFRSFRPKGYTSKGWSSPPNFQSISISFPNSAVFSRNTSAKEVQGNLLQLKPPWGGIMGYVFTEHHRYFKTQVTLGTRWIDLNQADLNHQFKNWQAKSPI